MDLPAIIFITSLWIASIFTFAKWRVVSMPVQKPPFNISADLVFQLYLKLSGLGVLGWIGTLLTAPNPLP